MRFSQWIVLLLCAVTLVVPHDSEAAKKRTQKKPAKKVTQVLGENDPRYAAVIMDPKTGEILHSRNATASRYPASLTKMMTLYVLFEEMAKGKIELDDTLRVSEYATTQPQTHISLDEGDRLPVEVAIKAMVVRSANDVSVVIAENIAGSVSRFADRMNATAAALGMKNTHFENPNGLPNDQQVTSALDMAKLGIALKRDFPQYYHYFSTREFSWNGVSYYTHNRVMLRYSGVDGIKTGYIGKSGFNLVTSVERGGRPLIGVVMGGTSGRWRDDKMIALLGDGYTVLAQRGTERSAIFASNLPRSPKGEATTVAQAAQSDQAVRGGSVSVDVVPVESAEQGIGDRDEGDVAASTGAARAAVVATDWGIQVGAYTSKQQATDAAKKALSLSSMPPKTVKLKAEAGAKKGLIHRARLENLTQDQAIKACAALNVNNRPCFIYKAGTENL